MAEFTPNLPPWLQLSEKQRKEDQALQKRLASAGPMTRLTPEERHLMRAAALQHHARTQLAVAEFHTSPEEVENARRTLAEGLAMAGEFEEAANIHPDKEAIERFLEIQKAIERDDNEQCEHIPEDVTINGKTVTLHPRILSETVFSKKHGKLMPVVRCVKCGEQNVRAPGRATSARAQAVEQARREAK